MRPQPGSPPRAGCFVVLEGGEGSGKTGAMGVLAASLQGWGHDVLQTREPGGTPEGLALRGLLLAEDGPDWNPYAELLLLVAARVQHVRRVIEPALAAGRTVLCDRFVGSTLAYQGAGRGLDATLILDLHRRAVGDLWPDLTVVLDVDPRIGLSRSMRRLGETGADEARFEALDLAFHARVRAAFLAEAARNRSVVVDAAGTLDEVQASLIEAVRPLLDRRPGGNHPAPPRA